jgi:LacI family transcriptional regulator
MKRMTIKDLALRLDVHPSTVSRALHDHPDISPEMKKRVQEAAHLARYRPNSNAVHLRKQTRDVIGLLVPSISYYFFPAIVQGISQEVQQSGHQLMILPSDDSLEQERKNVGICCANDVAGILISLSQESREIQHLLAAQNQGVPIVLFDKTTHQSSFPEVIIDDYQVAQNCALQLLEAGCRKLLGVFGNPDLMITQARLAGFSAAVAGFRDLLHVQTLFAGTSREAQDKVSELLRMRSIDGVFFMSDETLSGGMQALRDARVAIPRECSVIGISGGGLPDLFSPPVSHYLHDGVAVGRSAARKLLQLINDPQGRPQPERTVLNTTWQPGGSVRCDRPV